MFPRALVGGLLAAWVGGSAIRADDVTSRYFDGLRERRLFSLAEDYCRQRLSSPFLSAELRAQYTLELGRTYTEHARFAVGEEQAALWQQAEAVFDRFLEEQPRDPRRTEFAVQRAFIPAVRGEMLRWQVELQPYDSNLRNEAAAVLQAAIDRLKPLEQSLAGIARTDADPLRTDELLANVRFRLAAVLLDAARLLPAHSPDRAAHLIDARELLRILAGGTAEHLLTWHSHVLLAECDRLQRKYVQAEGRLVALVDQRPPRDVLDRAIAERAWLLLEQQQPDGAAKTIVTRMLDYRREGLVPPGELQYAGLQALVGLWELADANGAAETAAELLREIETRAEKVEREIGGYWALRCRLLVEQFHETRKFGRELAPLVMQARGHFAAGKLDEAARAFAAAAAHALEHGNTEAALELGYTRAHLQLHAEQYAAAAVNFREISERFPQSPRACEAHLAWAYCLGKLFEQTADDHRGAEYAAALREHLQRYGDSPTAVEAAWLLARSEEAAGRPDAALEHYRKIPADHAHAAEAQPAIARCYERILELLRQQGRPADSWEQSAVVHLGEFAREFPPDPAEWSLPQTETAVRFARILLGRRPADFAAADLWLRRARAAGKSDEKEWQSLRNTAVQLQILALAMQPQSGLKEALALVTELSAAPPTDLLGVVDGLSSLAEQSDPPVRRHLGEVQLQAALALDRRRAELPADDQSRLDRALAEAYLATDQPRRAAQVFAELVARAPRDHALRRQYSELLMRIGTTEHLQQAETSWRKLEALEQPGSRAWLEARYQLALCTYQLKRYNECRKLLGVTRLLYPDLGGEDLRARFVELQSRLKDAP